MFLWAKMVPSVTRAVLALAPWAFQQQAEKSHRENGIECNKACAIFSICLDSLGDMLKYYNVSIYRHYTQGTRVN